MKIDVRSAEIEDIYKIYEIIAYYTKQGEILERTIDDITDSLDKFFVALSEKKIIGVVSYYDYGINLKEIRSLAVEKNYRLKGVGEVLLNNIVQKLLELFPDAKIFALSYHPDFFNKYGFNQISRGLLPEKIWKDCKNCKNRDNCSETALIYSK